MIKDQALRPGAEPIECCGGGMMDGYVVMGTPTVLEIRFPSVHGGEHIYRRPAARRYSDHGNVAFDSCGRTPK